MEYQTLTAKTRISKKFTGESTIFKESTDK